MIGDTLRSSVRRAMFMIFPGTRHEGVGAEPEE